MKAVILIRVSSKEQESNHSLETQELNLKEYCQKNDLFVAKIFRLVESSTQGDRKKFKKSSTLSKNSLKRRL